MTDEMFQPDATAPSHASVRPSAADTDAEAVLLGFRHSIDNLDAALVMLLAERFKLTQRVGELKASRGWAPADPEREAEQVARLRRLADTAGLDPVFAEKFLSFVISEVVRHHERIAQAAK